MMEYKSPKLALAELAVSAMRTLGVADLADTKAVAAALLKSYEDGPTGSTRLLPDEFSMRVVEISCGGQCIALPFTAAIRVVVHGLELVNRDDQSDSERGFEGFLEMVAAQCCIALHETLEFRIAPPIGGVQ